METQGQSLQASATGASLRGKRVVVTRARAQAGRLRQELAARGAMVIELPTIEIRPPASWAALDSAIRRLEEFHYLLVTSARGAESLLARLQACGRQATDLKRLTVGAIGPATAEVLRRAGVRVDLVPRLYQAEGLIEALESEEVRGKAFLIPRAREARDVLPRALESRGARVEVVVAYETVAPDVDAAEVRKLLSPRPDAITFTSPSTVRNLASMLGEEGMRRALASVAIASIGPITSRAVRDLGLEVSAEASPSTVPALIEALAQYFDQPPRRHGDG